MGTQASHCIALHILSTQTLLDPLFAHYLNPLCEKSSWPLLSKFCVLIIRIASFTHYVYSTSPLLYAFCVLKRHSSHYFTRCEHSSCPPAVFPVLQEGTRDISESLESWPIVKQFKSSAHLKTWHEQHLTEIGK